MLLGIIQSLPLPYLINPNLPYARDFNFQPYTPQKNGACQSCRRVVGLTSDCFLIRFIY
jgi:hypothetical protein